MTLEQEAAVAMNLGEYRKSRDLKRQTKIEIWFPRETCGEPSRRQGEIDRMVEKLFGEG